MVPSAGVASRLYMWPVASWNSTMPRAHPVEQAHGQRLARVDGDVVPVVGEVADHLVDAVHPDGGEVVAQGPEIALGIGEEPGVQVTLDDLALDLQAVAGQIQQAVQRASRPASSPAWR